ncbi:unnamed protein product [Aphis gossypii]|uniref:Uncharacterized protein n=1 Tax=Aphis gossypii TaxID=80765 RepID=A0A9P0IPP9_APHGO|nr:unnamed protein product [Aphis gossypii]
MSLLSNYFKSLEGLDDILVYFDSTYVNGTYKSTITEYGIQLAFYDIHQYFYHTCGTFTMSQKKAMVGSTTCQKGSTKN